MYTYILTKEVLWPEKCHGRLGSGDDREVVVLVKVFVHPRIVHSAAVGLGVRGRGERPAYDFPKS